MWFSDTQKGQKTHRLRSPEIKLTHLNLLECSPGNDMHERESQEGLPLPMSHVPLKCCFWVNHFSKMCMKQLNFYL